MPKNDYRNTTIARFCLKSNDFYKSEHNCSVVITHVHKYLKRCVILVN